MYILIHTHIYLQIQIHHVRPHAHSYTYVQLRRVRAILFKGGEPPEECAFLVRAIPIGHDGITRATPP